MVESFSADEPRQLLAELCDLVAERVPAESDDQRRLSRPAAEAAEKRFAAASSELTERYQARAAAAEAEYAAVRREIVGEVRSRARRRRAGIRRRSARTSLPASSPAEIAAEQQRQDAQWEATTIAEAAKGGSGLELADIQAELDARWQELQAIARQAVELLQRRGQWRQLSRSGLQPARSWSVTPRSDSSRPWSLPAQQLPRAGRPEDAATSSAGFGR